MNNSQPHEHSWNETQEQMFLEFRDGLQESEGIMKKSAEKWHTVFSKDSPNIENRWNNIVNMFFQYLKTNGLEENAPMPSKEYFQKKLEANKDLYEEATKNFTKLTEIMITNGNTNKGGIKQIIMNDMEKIQAEKNSDKKLDLICHLFAYLFDQYTNSVNAVGKKVSAEVTDTLRASDNQRN